MNKVMFAALVPVLLCVAGLVSAQTTGMKALNSTNGATVTNKPDSDKSTFAFPGFTVQKKLKLGETMTATLTTSQDENGKKFDMDQTIKNKNGTTPTWEGTRGLGTDGVSFSVGGVVNGFNVNDVDINHVRTEVRPNRDIKTGYLTIASFAPDGNGGVNPFAIGRWLADSGYLFPNMLAIPDFVGANSDLYYGVDLAVWSSQGFALTDAMLDTDFVIADGHSDLLPGFVFSSDPFTFSSQGWDLTTPYSGSATLDSLTLIAAVPEPGTLALLGLGILLLQRRGRSGRLPLIVTTPGSRSAPRCSIG